MVSILNLALRLLNFFHAQLNCDQNLSCSSIVGILTFISRMIYRLWHSKSSILIHLGYFGIYEQFIFYTQLSSA